ncbi:MAG: cytochrome C biogenesis protein, partial [Betaproteobacteria bacterium]|nr:cytochrome C biogenesis protein [Betaproteobacteria bacterium]
NGWRGRKSIYISLTAFLFLLLSYLGSKFVLEIILHR